MRALIRPISVHAASSPIETIVFFFVLATLAYFHVLSAIKHSSFFAPTSLPPLRPSHALWHNGDWVTVQESEWYSAHRSHVTAVDLQQLVMSFDARTAKKVDFSHSCLIYVHQYPRLDFRELEALLAGCELLGEYNPLPHPSFSCSLWKYLPQYLLLCPNRSGWRTNLLHVHSFRHPKIRVTHSLIHCGCS